MEGLFGGFSNRFLFPNLIEAIGIDLFLVENVGFYNREELIIGFGAVEANNFLDVNARSLVIRYCFMFSLAPRTWTASLLNLSM